MTDAAESDAALCLDGTPSVYYHRPGTGSGVNKWYIHQQVRVFACRLISCVAGRYGALKLGKSCSRHSLNSAFNFSDDC